MTDNNRSLNNQDNQDNQNDQDNQNQKANGQDIFEETFNDLMNEFGKACEKHGVETAIAIAKHPNFDDPMVFFRAGHIIDAASMMANILRQIKTQLYTDLDTEPR